jgi:hypothetical protein
VSGADNQQERLVRLAYLAGIIDGEGWIGLTRHTNKEVRSGYTIIPVISIHMVGKQAIETIYEMFENVGLPSYYIHLQTSSRWSIKGRKRVVPVLEALLPHLRIKKAQAQLVLEYDAVRLMRPYRSSPTEHEVEIMDQVRALNIKGKNPQRLYA